MATRKPPRLNGRQARTKKVDYQQDAEAVVVAVADSSVEEKTPPIFNLIDDCCYAIFDFLSRRDLCLFGQTCKWAQQVAADFYKMKFSATTIHLRHDVDVFDLENAQKLKMDGIKLKPYRRMKTHCNQPVKQIHLNDIKISPAKVNCLKKILRTVEHVTIQRCATNGDFYENFLKFCENLKHLRCQYCYSNGDNVLIGADNAWLARKYPTLEHLEITIHNVQKINELTTFYVENPNVRSYTTNYEFFVENLDLFETTDIKLDTLAIRFDGVHSTALADYLNALHERGVFQRLHWYTEQAPDQMASLNGLEKLLVNDWDANKCTNISPHLVNIKELSIGYITNGSNMETIARNFVNLERVLLRKPTFEEILSFIRHSGKLTKIKIGEAFKSWNYDKYSTANVLDVVTWNKEREKLVGARKVTIYVPEEVYLATKWITHNTVSSLIELKRDHSYDWVENFKTKF